MNMDRFCALTDAIVAIAATIMVLELKVPDIITLNALLSEWTVLIAYIISFTVIYLSWYAHHNLFETINNCSSGLFLANGLWLFFLTLIPFVTALIGKDLFSPLAMVLYSSVYFLWTLSFQVLSYKAILDNPEQRDEISFSKRYILTADIIDIISIIFSFFYPIISLLIIVLVTVYMIFDLFWFD